MSLVRDLTPINLQEEKQKFFDQGCKTNPYFKYNTLVTLNKMYKYGQPKDEYLKLAKEIVDEAFKNRSSKEIRELEGEKITQEQAQAMINEFLKANDMEEIIDVRWSDKFLSRASFYIDTLKVRLPLEHHRQGFLATLYHELGTHALRRINYAQQPFFKKKNEFEFKDYLRTEEGLAGFHTLLAKNFKLHYTSALNYVVSTVAQEKSFVETYNFVRQYIEDPDRAWAYTVKHKRGLYDTSEAGGFTKDIVYFEGLIEVWQFLQQSNFDLEGLYLGKISYEDIDKAREMNPGFVPSLPHFIRENKQIYIDQLTEIAKINHFDELSSN